MEFLKNSLFLQIFLVDQPFWLDTDHFWVFDFSFLSFLFSMSVFSVLVFFLNLNLDYLYSVLVLLLIMLEVLWFHFGTLDLVWNTWFGLRE